MCLIQYKTRASFTISVLFEHFSHNCNGQILFIILLCTFILLHSILSLKNKTFKCLYDSTKLYSNTARNLCIFYAFLEAALARKNIAEKRLAIAAQYADTANVNVRNLCLLRRLSRVITGGCPRQDGFRAISIFLTSFRSKNFAENHMTSASAYTPISKIRIRPGCTARGIHQQTTLRSQSFASKSSFALRWLIGKPCGKTGASLTRTWRGMNLAEPERADAGPRLGLPPKLTRKLAEAE